MKLKPLFSLILLGLCACTCYDITNTRHKTTKPMIDFKAGKKPIIKTIKEIKSNDDFTQVNVGKYAIRSYNKTTNIQRKYGTSICIYDRNRIDKPLACYEYNNFIIAGFDNFARFDIDGNGSSELLFSCNNALSTGRSARVSYVFIIDFTDNKIVVNRVGSFFLDKWFNFRDINNDGKFEFILLKEGLAIGEQKQIRFLVRNIFEYNNGNFQNITKETGRNFLFEFDDNSDGWVKCRHCAKNYNKYLYLKANIL
ncbi:MAG: hypothetical protein GXO69_08450 [Acidobacteria bacterium]|nr:hypothetical protein [Acidobacteriota bacterium]